MARFEYQVIRDGAPLRSLKVLDSCTPTISFTADAEIKRTISGVVCAAENDVNWLNDELQVWQITSSGEQVPRGRFLVTTHSAKRNSDGTRSVDLTGYDYGYRVRNLEKLEHSETIPAGASYTDAIQAQLIAAGITRTILRRSAETLLTDHVYETGTTRYEIIQELLSEINYRDLWFDGTGNAVVEPWAPVTMENAKHQYGVGNVSIVTPDMTEDEDTFSAGNVFIELVSSADISADMRAESVNTNPNSPLSVIRRGIRIPDIETLDSIASQQALQTRADNRKMASMMSAITYTFSTGLMDDTAERGLNDGVILDRDGIGLMEEQDWTMSLRPGGLITHTAKKVYYT